MALQVCAGCTTVFSVGALRCPHCGSADYYEEGQAMPKITVHGGATNAAATDPAPVDLPDDEPTTPEEEPSPGNSSETSPEKQPSSEKPNAKQARSRARTTENPS